jgi:hypothetical protein
MITPYPSPMSVYNGHQRLGEIVDHGKGCVMAYLVTEGGRRVLLGRHPDRKAAMIAVSEAHKASGPQPPGAA